MTFQCKFPSNWIPSWCRNIFTIFNLDHHSLTIIILLCECVCAVACKHLLLYISKMDLWIIIRINIITAITISFSHSYDCCWCWILICWFYWGSIHFYFLHCSLFWQSFPLGISFRMKKRCSDFPASAKKFFKRSCVVHANRM